MSPHDVKSTPDLSVIITVRDMKEELPQIDHDVRQAFAEEESWELIYVDDGSTDGTRELLKAMAQKDAGARRPHSSIPRSTTFPSQPQSHSPPGDQMSPAGFSSVLATPSARALEAAMETADGREIVYVTSRVRANGRDLGRLVKRLRQDADVVVGRRTPRRDSRLNRAVSWLFNAITNRLTHVNLHDINSGVLAVKREVLEHVPFYGTLNAFLPVPAHRQGYRIVEEPIEQLPGRFASSLRPKDYVRRFLDLISIIFLSRYSKKPLHFLGFPGMALAAVGAVIDLYLFIYRLLGFGGIAGRPMLLLGTMLLVIGLQMIAVGLLGEMIIFTHARQIREYNIEEVIN